MLLPFLVALLLLLILVVSMLGSAGSADEEEESEDTLARASVQDRVDALVRSLDQSDAALAERRLQSMGPVVIGPLLNALRSLDEQRNALSVQQQIRIERVLVDFGPQTLRVVQRHAGRIHRASAAFPALAEVLARMGREALRSLLEYPSEVSPCLLALLLRKLETEHEQDELSTLLAESPNACRAAARILGRRPALLAELLGKLAANDTRRLWLEDGPLCSPLDHVEEPSAEQRSRYLGLLDACPAHPEALLALSSTLHDPRVLERFLRLVETPNEEQYWAVILALEALSRHGQSIPEHALSRCVRISTLGVEHIRPLQRIAARSPSLAKHAFATCMRSQNIDVQRAAIYVIARLDIDFVMPILLKALARHRFSELEDELAAPLLVQFERCLPKLLELLRQPDDHDLRLAALDLLVFHGAEQELSALFELFGQRDYIDHLLANAIESMGHAAIAALTAHLDTVPNGRLRELLSRRLSLLLERTQTALTAARC